MFNRITRAFSVLAGADPGPVNRDPMEPRWWRDNLGTGSWAGEPVTAQTALKIPALWAGLDSIATTEAALPFHLYERSSGGLKRATNMPLYELLHDQPNPNMTAFEFRYQMSWWLAYHRAAYAEIRPGSSGPVSELWPIHPAHQRMFVSQGRVWHEISQPGKPKRYLADDEVLALRLPPFGDDGLTPVPIYQLGAEAIGRALALMRYAAEFFKHGDGIGGAIGWDDRWFDNTESGEEFLKFWHEQTRGENRHKDVLLPPGGKWQRRSQSNEEAQFVDTWKQVELEVLKLLRVPPHKVGVLDRATFSNIEQQAIEWVTDTIVPYLTVWEQAVRRDLILNPSRFKAEHDVNGLLRGDTVSRFAAYSTALGGAPFMSVEEVRQRENLNRNADGEIPRPLNMAQPGDGGAGGEAGEDDAARPLTAKRIVELREVKEGAG